MRVWSIAQNRGSGSVAEKHTGIPIRPIDNRAEFLGSHDQDRIINVSRNELLSDFKRIKKTGTGCAQVKTSGIDGADLFLHVTRGSGKHAIRRGCSNDNQIDF